MGQVSSGQAISAENGIVKTDRASRPRRSQSSLTKLAAWTIDRNIPFPEH
jgi:hypothetical protein